MNDKNSRIKKRSDILWAILGAVVLLPVIFIAFVRSKLASPYDRPVYAFVPPPIKLQYNKCSKCNSYDGGIYGKGPLKHFRSAGAAKCIHAWQEITKQEFVEATARDFAVDWEKDEMPWWRDHAR